MTKGDLVALCRDDPKLCEFAAEMFGDVADTVNFYYGDDRAIAVAARRRIDEFCQYVVLRQIEKAKEKGGST